MHAKFTHYTLMHTWLRGYVVTTSPCTVHACTRDPFLRYAETELEVVCVIEEGSAVSGGIGRDKSCSGTRLCVHAAGAL